MGQTLRFGKHIFGAPEKSISLGELAASNPVGKAIPEDLTELLKAMRIKTDQGNNIIVKNTDEVGCNLLNILYPHEDLSDQGNPLFACKLPVRNNLGTSPRFAVLQPWIPAQITAWSCHCQHSWWGNVCTATLHVHLLSEQRTTPFIVIRPYNGEVEAQDTDRELGFYCVCSGEVYLEVFPASSILRGALIVPDYTTPPTSDSFVVDTNPDMFCRLNVLRMSRFQN